MNDNTKVIELLQEIADRLLASQMDLHKKRWLTPKELEIKYGFKEKTFVHYRGDKKVPFSKIGTKLIRYDCKKIDKWLEDHEIIGFENAG